jgi:nucleoid-associated protein YgaU
VATTTPPPVRTISTPPPAAAAAAPAPTVAPPSLTSANSANHTHIVKQGENYWTISVAEYGSGAYVNQLMAANPNIPANRLRIDMPIVVPPKDKVVPAGAVASAATAGPTTRPLNPAKEYRVKSGDSLYSISTALYGKADRLEKIYDLNKTAIGPDKGKLKLGMVLQLPEPPTAGTSSRVADITR